MNEFGCAAALSELLAPRPRTNAADVLGDVEVAVVVGMDALVPAATEDLVERVDLRRPARVIWITPPVLPFSWVNSSVLVKGLQARAIDRIEARSGGAVGGREQRDAMDVAARYVQIDARDVGQLPRFSWPWYRKCRP